MGVCRIFVSDCYFSIMVGGAVMGCEEPGKCTCCGENTWCENSERGFMEWVVVARLGVYSFVIGGVVGVVAVWIGGWLWHLGR